MDRHRSAATDDDPVPTGTDTDGHEVSYTRPRERRIRASPLDPYKGHTFASPSVTPAFVRIGQRLSKLSLVPSATPKPRTRVSLRQTIGSTICLTTISWLTSTPILPLCMRPLGHLSMIPLPMLIHFESQYVPFETFSCTLLNSMPSSFLRHALLTLSSMLDTLFHAKFSFVFVASCFSLPLSLSLTPLEGAIMDLGLL